MSERENILGRIREALRIPAPMPGVHGAGAHETGPAGSPRPAATHAREWLPATGEGFAALVDQFRANSADLKTSFHLLDSAAALPGFLRELRARAGWSKIAYHRAPLSTQAAEALGLPSLCVDGGYDVHELESCDVGITECDALVAQTGSLVVTSRSSGGRALSVLPPHHLVVARREQLVADLPAAFEFITRRYAPDYPSMISLVTGPSRTGDIERILVLGAHGPKELTVVCV
jgi:L-lactate dehydrogenase complex protein LldG